MPSATIIEFGRFRFDQRRRLLWRDADLLSVPPKALDLLAALIEECGEVVTKDDLLQKVWPDTFVEEANLSVNVSILRKTLGNRPEGRAWIETVPRRGYRFVGPVLAAARPLGSLAVLPFRPLVVPEAEDWLGLGMADALITRLSSTGKIVVRPTSSVRRFTAPDIDPLDAGRQLRVDAVLDTRMQREGSRLRLTVQLLPVDGSAPLWASQLEEEHTRLFALEDAIADRLATALTTELTADERARLGHHHTESFGAYRAYCRGRVFWGRFAPSWIEKAVRSFMEAAALDPRYALPHAGLADAHLIAGFSGYFPPERAWPLARTETERALALDDRLPEAWIASAFLHLVESSDWASAEKELRRAIDLGPQVASTHQWWAFVQALRGHIPEASEALQRAEELDPLSLTISAFRGLLLSLENHHAREIEQQQRTVELDPHQFLGHWALGIAFANSGRFREAVSAHRRALELADGSAFLRPVLARSLALAGEQAEARQILASIQTGSTTWRPHYQLATVWLGLGDTANALGCLQLACEKRDPWIILIGVDPMLGPLRGHPAFEDLARRVHADRR